MDKIAVVKNNLHELVVQTQDAEVLQKVEDYFRDLISGKDWWAAISAAEKDLIQKGTAEIENGQGIAHAEVRKQVDQLLHKN
ncbi:MAG: hypothetical protein AAF849_23835 [Bacteroidota bacterium]